VEQFQEHFDCWNRGELDSMLDLFADDAVFDVSAVFTDVAPAQGRDEIRRYWRTLRETWQDIRLDPIEGFDIDGRRFVIEQRWSSKGARSGIEIDQRVAVLYTIRPQDQEISHAQFEDQKVSHAQLLPDVGTAISVADSSSSEVV
jgi:ketosteroid isomerase-like protein